MDATCCDTMRDNCRGGPISVETPDYPTPVEFDKAAPFAVCIKEPSYYGEVLFHAISFCPWCGQRIKTDGYSIVPAIGTPAKEPDSSGTQG